MAERRMFSKSVIGSARFLRMPAAARLLYYDLGMQADDDGVVEAFAVLRTTGAAEEDLNTLASKGFVQIMNDDLVTYITDWSRNNYIQKDRYRQSIYQELLAHTRQESGLYPICIQSGYGMDTQDRIGKDRIEEDRTGECIGDKPPRAQFIPPTVDEVRSYCMERNNSIDPEHFVDYYQTNGWVQRRGSPIRDWKAAVRSWEHREKSESPQPIPIRCQEFRTIIVDGEEVDVPC